MSGGFKYKQSAVGHANTAQGANTFPDAAARRAKIAFIERKHWRKNFLAFSLEKVFEQVSRELDGERYHTVIKKVPYGNSVQDVLRNLMFFERPQADIYHVTGQINYMALRLPRDRTVLTIHDLAFLQERNMGRLRRSAVKKLYLDLPVMRARFVTAVSEATKQAIVAHTKCDPARIRVIANPVQKHYAGSKQPFNKRCPSILQIGITQNKNISRLLAALREVPCRLTIVGNVTDELKLELDASRVDYKSVLGLSDMEMRAAYDAADIVAFCSTYEGFGLPIIEAQAMSTPVLTSDLAPMNDVAGGAAALVDPFDIASIRNGLLRLIEDDRFRNEMILAGLENVKRFEAEKIASQYAELYEEILTS